MIDCIDKAIELLKAEKEPEVKICSSSAYWIPLQWLYVRMIENKDLVPVSSLPMEEKIRLWRIVTLTRPEKKEGWVRIMIVQALFAYENRDNK